MAMAEREAFETAEAELLLPWHAVGALDACETAALEHALARSPALAFQVAAIRREREEIIRLNEALGAPSPRARAKLFAMIEADAASNRRRPGE
jgi:hypothetical protein